jgi:diguanylate cyclase (GGDEF)-like protein
MLVVELKQAKEKAEKFARELRSANEALRRLAFRDGLTGLYNHRSFQEMLEKELSRAQRYKRQLSLVMLDIDHFKKINDTYGHLQGDLVLKVIASKLESSLRKSSFVARYGGEEFALILPEADGSSAMVVAERCRRAVEQMTIQVGNHTIRATISVGATTYSPEMHVKDKTQLIEAADRALYNSKKTGRNKISFTALTESPGSPTGGPA